MAKSLKNLLVNYIHDRQMSQFVAKYISGITIDIGCGSKPYTEMLKSYVSSHIGIDHLDTYRNPGIYSLPKSKFLSLLRESERKL